MPSALFSSQCQNVVSGIITDMRQHGEIRTERYERLTARISI